MTLVRTATRPQPLQVVVVGGGAAAVIAVLHLLRATTAQAPVDVHLVERDQQVGPGLAYRSAYPRHTVNNFAERLSAVDGDPGHLIRWCAARGLDLGARSFPARKVYGDYLAALLDEVEVPAGSSLRRLRDEAVDLRPDGRRWALDLGSGHSLAADRVVLALGNPPPHAHPRLAQGPRFVADPWAQEWRQDLAGVRRVLLLGTGLTMVDLAIELEHLLPRAEIVAASRRGALPSAHVVEPTDGSDWRDAVDAVRGFANQLWTGLAPGDQARFATTYAHAWDRRRHRMSPAAAHHVERLQAAGTLVVRTLDQVDPAEFDLVVSCTGPRPVPTSGWNPLVDAMLERGLLRPHRLGLGADLVAPGHPVDQHGHVLDELFWLGAARKGLEWEVGAIPDLRAQAVLLARALAPAAEEAADERAPLLR
ncbi:FAD/NAD(P)-binding protein [Nocardioides campestrisoli]|uniref:FAD/NAD(P)-binding protein n=1 Tax=Nocardioides campestrisoli TaxID=2736757 RepID=UPI0015E7C96E|nr:FAD/NAD(P)-binding protein [Nocardioides campestrisoli]